MHLDHVTIRTRNLAATRSLFLQVFDLEERVRPLNSGRSRSRKAFAARRHDHADLGLPRPPDRARDFRQDGDECRDRGHHEALGEGIGADPGERGRPRNSARPKPMPEWPRKRAEPCLTALRPICLPEGSAVRGMFAQGYLFAIDNPFVTGAVIDIDGGAPII